jgi:hypothetical protein
MQLADDVFSIIGEGAALLAALDEGSDSFFDDLTRLHEILAILGESAPAAAPPTFTLDRHNPKGTSAAMLDYLARPTLPPAVAAFDATTVWLLAREMALPDVMEAAKASTQVDQSPEGLNKARVAVFDHFVSQGVSRDFDLGRILKGQQEAVEILKRGVDDNPEYVAAREEFHRISDARGAKWKEYVERLHALDTQAVHADSKERAQEIMREHDAIYAEFNAWKDVSGEEELAASKRMNDVTSAFFEKRAADYHATYMEDGEAIRARVLEVSPVTHEEAQEWAAKQVFNQAARDQVAKLKPAYPLEQIVQDMAEFYRMSGGRASTVQFSVDGGVRANAMGVETLLEDKTINIGSYFNKRVLWHELSHFIENDPVAKAASNGFLISRRESEQTHKLKDLVPKSGYEDHEIAYKDSFVDPYVGKVYPEGVTEVFSMGVERLCNPKDASIFAAQDPEMFDLITGYLRTGVTPAMRAKLAYHDEAIAKRAAALAQKEKDYAAAWKFFVAQGALTADDWWEQMPTDAPQRDSITKYIAKYAKPGTWAYVGSNGDYRVFSGTFKDSKTKRWAKGYMLMKALPANEWSLPDYTLYIGKPDRARAALAIHRASGESMNGVYWQYIEGAGGAYDWKQKTIDLWKSMQ